MSTATVRTVLFLLVFALNHATQASPEPASDAALAALANPNPARRVEALRELMTSLDPRLPEAFLPLLRDEGDSIRRLAARGIGSRWWQIEPRHRGKFVAALRDNAQRDDGSMARRGIALLTGNHRVSGVVYPSPDGRWVAYERRKLPCVIDTANRNEELVGWNPDPAGDTMLFAPAWGELQDAEPAALWHPRSTMVALVMQTRRNTNVWIWQPGGRLRRLETEEICAALAPLDGAVNELWGVDIRAEKWKGDELFLAVDYALESEEDRERSAAFSWNAKTDTLRLLGRR